MRLKINLARLGQLLVSCELLNSIGICVDSMDVYYFNSNDQLVHSNAMKMNSSFLSTDGLPQIWQSKCFLPFSVWSTIRFVYQCTSKIPLFDYQICDANYAEELWRIANQSESVDVQFRFSDDGDGELFAHSRLLAIRCLQLYEQIPKSLYSDVSVCIIDFARQKEFQDLLYFLYTGRVKFLEMSPAVKISLHDIAERLNLVPLSRIMLINIEKLRLQQQSVDDEEISTQLLSDVYKLEYV